MLAKRLRFPIQAAPSRPLRSIRKNSLTLKVFSTNLPYGRFGVIIPKAVAKTAVLRNRLKRAAFDAFYTQRTKLPNHDLLCIVSRGAPLTKDAMMEELNKLFSEL